MIPPKKPKLGRAVKWSDADLDQMSEVQPRDIASADALWRKHVSGPLADLLDAAPLEPDGG